jgi:hypothetical protein
MNRRKAMLGVAAGSLAATTVSFAQNAQGNQGNRGPIGTNLLAVLPGSQGTFAIQRFAAVGGVLNAIGTLTAANGWVTTLAVPASVQSLPSDPPATCPILTLTLGPINLNLLGLVVSVPTPITINIVAIPGPGNLLGNLLCAVANLLNSGPLATILNQLVTLLNQLLASL